MSKDLGTGGVLLRIGLGMFVVRFVFSTFLQNTAAMVNALVFGLAIAGVWGYQQFQEAKEAEKERQKDRRYGGSIWDD